MAGVPLSDQIAELKRLAATQAGNIKNAYWLQRSGMTEAQAQAQQDRLLAAIKTLEWLQRHEAEIKDIIGRKE